jgi:hypothetical protein
VVERKRSSPLDWPVQPHQFGLLIDENLTPDLVKIARQRRFRARHVNEVNLRTSSDAAVARFALEEGLVVVTSNMADFRKLYARRKMHPGLIRWKGGEPLACHPGDASRHRARRHSRQ